MQNTAFFYVTCTDCNGLHELLSPGVCSHHQSQVGLLDQLVHRALRDTIPKKQTRKKSIIYTHRLKSASMVDASKKKDQVHELHHMMAVASSCRQQKHVMKTTQQKQTWWVYSWLRGLEDAYKPESAPEMQICVDWKPLKSNSPPSAIIRNV